MTKATIRATKSRESKASTLWCIEWIYPPMSGIWGSTYWATTYPDSDQIYLQTGAKRRHVATGQATKLLPLVRSAIEQARQAA